MASASTVCGGGRFLGGFFFLTWELGFLQHLMITEKRRGVYDLNVMIHVCYLLFIMISQVEKESIYLDYMSFYTEYNINMNISKESTGTYTIIRLYFLK